MDVISWFDDLGTVLAVVPPVLALTTAVGGLVVHRADARLRARRDDLMHLANEERDGHITSETRRVAEEAAEFLSLVLAERGRISAARVSQSFVKGLVRNLVVFGILGFVMAAALVGVGILNVQQGNWLVGCLLISYAGVIGFAWVAYLIDGRRVRRSTPNLQTFAAAVSESTPLTRVDTRASTSPTTRHRVPPRGTSG